MILKKKSAKKSSSQQICDKNVTCQLEFSGLEELGQVAADVTSCQIMAIFRDCKIEAKRFLRRTSFEINQIKHILCLNY